MNRLYISLCKSGLGGSRTLKGIKDRFIVVTHQRSLGMSMSMSMSRSINSSFTMRYQSSITSSMSQNSHQVRMSSTCNTNSMSMSSAGDTLDAITQQQQRRRRQQPLIVDGRRYYNMSSNDDSSTASTSSSDTTTTNIDPSIFDHPECNIPQHIIEKVVRSKKLYQIPSHPLHTIKHKIEEYFSDFIIQDSLSPIVTTKSNFDSLLIPFDHVSRSKSDTYYVHHQSCLRTHTSAHQSELLSQGYTQFLCTGDVYRRDDIDKSHYPVFHQMEGVKVFPQSQHDNMLTQQEILNDLQSNLEGLAQHLFGPVECRWVEEYFPFTHPSLELEIRYQNEWLEVLGCGVMQPQILQDAGLGTTNTNHNNNNNLPQGWAFGLGLERLAMILFQIPDIRLFWSQDERFWNQFQKHQITTFQSYSKYPPCYKDVSFWIIHPEQFHTNDVLDVTRQVAGDLVEQVTLVDQFHHPKTQRQSHCYRITYRSMDRSLTNHEIDHLQHTLRTQMAHQLPIELR